MGWKLDCVHVYSRSENVKKVEGVMAFVLH